MGIYSGLRCPGRRKACSFGCAQTLTRQDANIRKSNVGATLAVAPGAAPDNFPDTIPNVYTDPVNAAGKIQNVSSDPVNAAVDMKTTGVGSKRAGARRALTSDQSFGLGLLGALCFVRGVFFLCFCFA